MHSLEKTEHTLITVYGDDDELGIGKALQGGLTDRETRVLAPQDEDTLIQAAQNSAVTIIGIKEPLDRNLRLAARLHDNRLVVGSILAFVPEDIGLSRVHILSKGYDNVITRKDFEDMEFKRFLQRKIMRGGKRLSTLILEEEYRRICDALSHAPASMIVFDADKRAVFVSDHYFRAYPKIAPRLIRGLSVYDAFDMMMKEEGMEPDDPRFKDLQKFWHNLQGNVEFSIDNKTTYRLKAVELSKRRGTVVMGQNISDYEHRKIQLEDEKQRLHAEVQDLKEKSDAYSALLNMALRELTPPLEGMRRSIKTLEDAPGQGDSTRKAITNLCHVLGCFEDTIERIEEFENGTNKP